jgi:two-component system, sensor histidine kinase and response regulator
MAEIAQVLVVDDDPGARDTFEALLSTEPAALRFAAGGAEALDRVAEFPPDLILLDVMMPGMDGFEVCRRLKADPRWAPIPVILITALESRRDMETGFEAGADEFLVKPVRGGELRVRVRSMLRIKRLYDRLLETLRLREELAHMIVHDMKSPVSVIMGMSEFLSLKMAGELSEEGARGLEKIREQGTRLNDYLTDMLMLAKMEAGAPILHRAPVDVNELLRAAARHGRSMAPGRGVDVEVDLPPSSRTLSLDRNLIHRVFDNLIGNALKFSPDTGRVTIEARYPEGPGTPDLRVRILDEGPGIPEAHRERIFEKYEVADMKRRGIPQYGLGLVFCKMVVNAHGGRIHAEANHPKGAIFVVSL